MSARPVIVLLALWGCSSHDKQPAPPALPNMPAPRAPERLEVAMPTVPTPAFTPSRNGRCEGDYHLEQTTCVHGAYAVGGEPLARALADYARGVASPILGAAPRKREAEPGPLGPGSLSRSVGDEGDAGSAKERRLADLDAMLGRARETLRLRDEASKAKRVEMPPSDAGKVTSLVASPDGGLFHVTSQDPAAARVQELSQIAHQLSPEQLQSMAGELSKLGIDPKQLEALTGPDRANVPPQHTQPERGF